MISESLLYIGLLIVVAKLAEGPSASDRPDLDCGLHYGWCAAGAGRRDSRADE